jgi:hypothetical protein
VLLVVVQAKIVAVEFVPPVTVLENLMKVKELIEILSKAPPEFLPTAHTVVIQGE